VLARFSRRPLALTNSRLGPAVGRGENPNTNAASFCEGFVGSGNRFGKAEHNWTRILATIGAVVLMVVSFCRAQPGGGKMS